MSIPRLCSTEAIVIRKTELGEADCILTLYTPRLGKVRAVAKGARRPKSRLGGHVEVLAHSQLMLVRSRNLDIVTQSQTIHSFLGLRDDLWRTSSALYVVELVDRLTAEEEENHPLFRLVVDTLDWLCRARHGDMVLRHFELHLLGHLGYRPQLEQCVVCQSAIRPAANYFSPSGGGVVCPGCASQESVLHPISVNALKVLRFLQRSEHAAVDQLKVGPELSLELRQLMQRYLRYLLERELKSAQWLDRLEKERLDSRAS